MSNFDKRGESEGISIVIESQPKGNLINDGKAHVVEYKYNKKDLDNAKGNPYVQIIESLYDALKTGVYEDKTGLAKKEEANDIRFRFIVEEGYRKIAGEVEARNVQSRMSLTDEERCASLASETEDVAREDQIILDSMLNDSAESRDKKEKTSEGAVPITTKTGRMARTLQQKSVQS